MTSHEVPLDQPQALDNTSGFGGASCGTVAAMAGGGHHDNHRCFVWKHAKNVTHVSCLAHSDTQRETCDMYLFRVFLALV